MLTVIPKWLVELWDKEDKFIARFYVNDNFYSNVLRKVAEIEFLAEVKEIRINKAD